MTRLPGNLRPLPVRSVISVVIIALLAALLPTTSVAASVDTVTPLAPAAATALDTAAPAPRSVAPAKKSAKNKCRGKAAKKKAKCAATARSVVPTVGASTPASPTSVASFRPGRLGLPKRFTKKTKVRKKGRTFKKLVSVGGPGSGRATVSYVGKKRSWAAGSTPLAFTVSRTGKSKLRLGVDLTRIGRHFGGQYMGRVTPMLYRDCSRQEIASQACQGEDVASRLKKGDWLRFTVRKAKKPVFVVMELATGSVAGDYRQPASGASDSWVSGGSSGAFTYAYPIAAPPPIAGDAPSVRFGYNSQATDTQTTDSNGQSSWLGEGWNWDPGYVEQLYVPCKKDEAGNKVGDLCWDSPYDDIPADNDAPVRGPGAPESKLPAAVLHLGGKSTELIWDPASSSWHMLDDEGWHISRENTGDNDTYGNWWWRIRDLSGNEYWFGYGKRYSNNNDTESVGRVPVYGDDKGEPCHQKGETRSDCDQGYQLHLDRYIDSNGNVTEFSYTQEMNKYETIMGGVAKHETLTYTAAIYPDVTSYGMNTSGTKTPQASMDVGLWGRCVDGAKDPDPFTGKDPCANPYKESEAWREKNADEWPDTPLNLICTSGPCGQASPTFFDTNRFRDITTTAGGSEVSRTAGVYKLPANKPSLSSDLWLSSLQTRSSANPGQTLKTPVTAFTPVVLPNNVGGPGDITRSRMRTITNAQGGTVTAKYNNEDSQPCQRKDLSSDKERAKNTSVCFPVWGDFDDDPVGDDPRWNVFRRYVTVSVTESSATTKNTGASADVTTSYNYGLKSVDSGYNTQAAWAWTNALVRPGKQTWNQWRGYSLVYTTRSDMRQSSSAVYFRGMNGTKDSPSGGTRTATISYRGASVSDTRTIADQPWLAGKPIQTVSASGSSNFQQSWSYTGYSTFDIGGTKWPSGYPAHQPRLTAVGQQSAYRYGATNVAESTTTNTTLDVVRAASGAFAQYPYLRASKTVQLGSAIPTTCTSTSYQNDTTFDAGAGVVRVFAGFPVQTTSWNSSDCTGQRLAQSITNYDGTGGPKTRLTSGNITHTKQWVSENLDECPDTFATYDSLGRVVEQTAPNGAYTKIDYSSSTSYPTTVTSTRSPSKGSSDTWTTKATMRASDGAVTSEVDVNGRTSTFAIDSFGRTTSTVVNGVQQSATSYEPVTTGSDTLKSPVKVTSRAVTTSGALGSPTVAYFDGFGQQVTSQTAAMNADGTPSTSQQVVTATSTNSLGLTDVSAKPVLAQGSPSAGLAFPQMSSVPVATSYDYDWTGQVTQTSTTRPGASPLVTTASYPNGALTRATTVGRGTAVTQTDVLGRTVSSTQYKSGEAGSAQTGTFTFDAAGNMSTYSFAGSVWTYTYDQMGRRVSAVDPDTGTTSYNYDLSSNVVATVAAAGTVKSAYDWLGRVTETTDGTGTILSSFAYDPAGHKGVLKSSTSHVASTAYTTSSTSWDDFNRPLDQHWNVPASDTVPAPLAAAASDYTESFTYGADGSITSTTYSGVAASGTTILAGERLATTYATGTGAPVKAVSTPDGGAATTIASTAWTPLGQVDSRSWSAGISGQGLTRAFTWDQLFDVPNRIRTTVGSTPIADVRIGYSDTGNPDVVSDTVADQSVCHSYDGYQQLRNTWTKTVGSNPTSDCGNVPDVSSSSWITGNNPLWQSWTFDNDTGKPTSRVEGDPTNPAAAVTTSYTYDVAGHPSAVASIASAPAGSSTPTSTTSYTYDNAGRRATSATTGTGTGSQTWQWDPQNRPAQVTTTGDSPGTKKFVYDSSGSRLVHASTSTVTVTVGATEITAAPAGTGIGALRQLSSAGALTGYRSSTVESGAIQYTAVDVQGSGVIQANPATLTPTTGWSAQTYAPYGTPRPTGPTSWTGKRGWLNLTHDTDTNLTQTGARLYDRGLQQFISPDPLLNTGLPNPYLYSGNNPVGGSDPSGLLCMFGSCGSSGSWCIGTCGADDNYGALNKGGDVLHDVAVKPIHGAFTGQGFVPLSQPPAHTSQPGVLKLPAYEPTIPQNSFIGGVGAGTTAIVTGAATAIADPVATVGAFINSCGGAGTAAATLGGSCIASAVVDTVSATVNNVQEHGYAYAAGNIAPTLALAAATRGAGRILGGLRTAPRTFSNLAPGDLVQSFNRIPNGQLSKINGQFNYVVKPNGELVVGRSFNGHIDLAQGGDVTAAGRVRVVGGEVKWFDNASGHYKPNGSGVPLIARGAFESQGLAVPNGTYRPVG